MKIHSFNIPEDFSITIFSEFFDIRKRQGRIQRITYFDTFDWRMYTGGYTVFCDDDQIYLFELKDQTVTKSGFIETNKNLPQNFIKHIINRIEMRALLDLCTVNEKINQINILNNERKITAKIEIVHYSVAGKKKVSKLNFIPLKGYDKTEKKILGFLKSQNFERSEQTGFDIAMQLSGLTPGSYSSKVNVKLSADMPCGVAFRAILKNLYMIFVSRSEEPAPLYLRLMMFFQNKFITGLKGILDILVKLPVIFGIWMFIYSKKMNT